MASAQVLPNSAASARKQEHLEAGKRRLEEFRKKKAAERVKKSASSTQVCKPDASLNGKQLSETEHVRASVLDGVSTSNGVGGIVIDTSTTGSTDVQSLNLFTQSNNGDYLGRTSPARNDLNTTTGLVETRGDDEIKRSNASDYTGAIDVSQNNESNQSNNIYGIHAGGLGRVPYGTTNNKTTPLHSQRSQQLDDNISQPSFHGMNETQSNKSNSPLKDYTISDHVSSYFPSKISPQNSLDTLLRIKPSNSSTLDGGYSHGPFYGGSSDSLNSDVRKTIPSSGSELPNIIGGIMQKFDSMGLDAKNSPDHIPLYPVSTESNSRRSRSSFLDSLNFSRPSSGFPLQQMKHDNNSSLSNYLESNSFDISGYTHLDEPSKETKYIFPFSNFTIPNARNALEHSTTLVSNSNSQEMLNISANENNMDQKDGFYSTTQNEDFAALEQHIEDLTQEKFSLQRALDASQTLAESLASENSSLTDSYNKQRSAFNQLTSDMEILQKEIKAQLVELEVVKSEYTNVQLECNAADERAKLLASEVIGLEEKALRLRSSELKLGKQLQNAETEISSCRRKISNLEKDRHDLQSTIDALQEEKKLLLSKLQKASGMGKSIENPNNKKDVSTSTEDIANEDGAAHSSCQEMHDSAAGHDAVTCNFSSSAFGVSRVNIPHDHMRMIENINALISELALEKEELMKALTSESSECTKLKELNKELTRKLKVQTQRLELLTAQSMSNENIPVKQPGSRTDYENARYADEGDEVVERVLGWIMKLFPGGPSKRRTSKLL